MVAGGVIAAVVVDLLCHGRPYEPVFLFFFLSSELTGKLFLFFFFFSGIPGILLSCLFSCFPQGHPSLKNTWDCRSCVTVRLNRTPEAGVARWNSKAFIFILRICLVFVGIALQVRGDVFGFLR